MNYKIVRHPKNEACEPRVMLARTMEEVAAGEIQSVIILTIDADGIAEARWSDQNNADLCYSLKVFEAILARRLMGED
jgi:hypothetical protein